MYSEVFPTRLRKARNITGFTLKEVEQETNISYVSLSHYETNKREPDMATLATLADFYGTSSDWLIGIGHFPEFEPNYKWDGLKVYADKFQYRLKLARMTLKLSQANAANDIGIPRSTLTKYELGQLQPSLETLAIMCLYYRISCDWLLGLGKHADLLTPEQLREKEGRETILKAVEKDAKAEQKKERRQKSEKKKAAI